MMTFMKTFLTLLFFATPSSSEMGLIVILALMIILISIDLFLLSSPTVLVVAFLLGFLSGMVVLICFFVKVCFSHKETGLPYSLVMLLTFSLVSMMSYSNHGMEIFSYPFLYTSSSVVVEWDSNQLVFLFVLLILLFILFSIEILMSHRWVKLV